MTRVTAVVRRPGAAVLAALDAQDRPADALVTHPGGWHEAIAAAGGARGGEGWLWLVEGDVAPAPDALVELLAARDTAHASGLPAPAVLASKVVDATGRIDARCAPWPPLLDREIVIAAAVRHLASLRMVRWGSLLVDRGALERHGPPRAELAGGADDLEWSVRVLRDERGYLAPRSVARVDAAGRRSLRGPREVRDRLRMLGGPGWVAQEPVWFAFMLAVELAPGAGRRAGRAGR
jgi:hypothetical protein